MFTKKQAAHAKSFGSFHQNDCIFQTKVALMTFYNRKYADWTEKIILILEYLQLISLSLVFHTTMSSEADSNNSSLSNLTIYFIKLANPSSLMPLNMFTSLSSTILLVILCCVVLKYFLFIYVAVIAYWNFEGNNILLTLWRLIFKIQSRLLCCFLTSFWSAVIIGCSRNTFQVEGISKSAIIGICCGLMAIEYFLSFAIEIYFNYVLPTKNFLSAKNCTTQTSTLLQKLLLQIISLGYQSNFYAGVWVFSIINLTFTIIKIYQCYDQLILYHIKAILAQNHLHSLVISLNITCFFHTILYRVEYHGADADFIIIVWFIMAILIARVSHEVLLKRIRNVLNPSVGNNAPEILMHKVPASKELRKYVKMPGKLSREYHFSYLHDATENANKEKIFGLDAEFCKEHLSNSDDIYVQYLIKLSNEFPTNTLVKLYLTQTCLEDPSRHLKAIKTTNELATKKWSMSFLSATLLVYEIEKTVLARHHNNENTLDLDLFNFIKSQMFIEELEIKMLEQADLKIKICENILGETSKIGLIYNFAQQVDKCKEQILKKVKLLPDDVPDYHIEPFLLIAGYHLVLEYSQKNFQKYIDIYIQKFIKYEKYFQSANLRKVNLYQNENIFLILSGAKVNCGQILFCSDSIRSVSGLKVEASRGSHVSTLFTPSFQSYYLDNFRQLFEIGEKTLLNKIQRAFFYNKDGYVVEVEFILKIHPYLTQGLYLNMIARPTNASREYILVKEDGSIEGATKGLADNLSRTRLSQLSSKLPNLLEVSNTHTSETRRIGLMPTEHFLGANNNREEKSYYECNISFITYGSISLKVIELDKFNADADGIEGEINRSVDRTQKAEDILRELKIGGKIKHSLVNLDSPRSEDIDCDENVQDNPMLVEWKGNTDVNTAVLTTDRRLLTDRTEKDNAENVVAHAQLTRQMNLGPNLKNIIEKDNDLINDIPEMMSTQEINFSSSKTSNRAFRRALAIDFHPRSFRAICLMFYGGILITLLSQVILKVISDQTTEALLVKTTLLSLSQLRTFSILLITVNARGNLDNILDPDLQNGQTYTGMAQTVENMQGHAVELKSYNDQIIHNLYLLSDDIKETLFVKDTRVFGTYVDSTSPDYRYTTTFDVVDEVIGAIGRLGAIADNPEQLVGNLSTNIHNFILLNDLNDYLYKSQEITNVFVDSVKSEKDYFQGTITFCLILSPLLLAGIALMLIVIISFQYNVEKKHMLAFIRLRPKAVKDIQKRLFIFKGYLAQKDSNKFKQWLESIEESVTTIPQDEHAQMTMHMYNNKKNNTQVIDESETRSRYARYIVQVVFYILILIGLTLVNFISAQNSAKVIYRRQSQVEFANFMSETIGVIYCASGALFETNNTYRVRHQLASTTFIEGLAAVTSMITQIPTAFQEEDGTYDPTIENMIFHYKTCDPYNFIPLHLYFCNFMLTNGAHITLLPLVTVFRDVVQGKISDFKNCDKSTLISLFNCAYLNIDYFLPSFVLSAIEAQMIGDVAMNNLEKSISNAKYQRKVFLIAFSVSLGVISILIWLQILKKLKDVHNDFKKVLQIFPPRLTLSSFLLKNFLMLNMREN